MRRLRISFLSRCSIWIITPTRIACRDRAAIPAHRQVWQQGNVIFLFSARWLRQSRRIDSLCPVIRVRMGDTVSRRRSMLDGKRYFSEFPDEDPDGKK